MTRCKDFYEKLEKDGNFCGMRERDFRDAMKYWDEYRAGEEEDGAKAPLSERAWIESERKQAASHKLVEPEKPKEEVKKLWGKVEQAEYTQLFVRTMVANGVDITVIRELVVKAISIVELE